MKWILEKERKKISSFTNNNLSIQKGKVKIKYEDEIIGNRYIHRIK